jgi:hypothetical protein
VSLQGQIGVIAGAVITPLVLRLFVIVARGQRPEERKGTLVFRRNRAMRYFGFIGTCLFCWPIVLFAVDRETDITWWMSIIFGFFALLLASFWMVEICL